MTNCLICSVALEVAGGSLGFSVVRLIVFCLCATILNSEVRLGRHTIQVTTTAPSLVFPAVLRASNSIENETIVLPSTSSIVMGLVRRKFCTGQRAKYSV